METGRVDLENDKQNVLTATYPLSVSGDDVHFSWASSDTPYEEILDSLESGADSSSISQLIVRVSPLEIMH